MKITVHTKIGTFVGMEQALDAEGLVSVKQFLKNAVKGEYSCFDMKTESGFIVIGEDLLKSAVFVVE